MVTVTERAARELRARLLALAPEPGYVLRLAAGPTGLILILDVEREGDQLVEFEGEAVLVIAPELSEALHGSVIDCEEREGGAVLTISREGA